MLRKILIGISIIFCFVFFGRAQSNQLAIERIELMPGFPQPYQMRNWKQVAQKYDSLIFDATLSGTYLPLVKVMSGGINYPHLGRFVMPSYVGASEPWTGEAINQLPAVISGTLVGIDKTNQFGQNWVALCQDFFNNRPEENVYLNNFNGQSGNDWWYDTMPNVFFYQLTCLYPTSNFQYFDQQFETIAQRWLQALKQMGGSATPWQVPNLNHRAWRLSTMQANDQGVKEPEAAGAIGWLLYQAYIYSENKEYLMGAEWCMEFLDQWTKNPSYELQLPYGVYTAARMNAELHTSYNIQKMLNWCFDPQDNVRGWGVTLGNWNGYDCAGLVGEVIGDDYAFAMNTFEMIGALAPLVRYDERFARAIGKWTLNAANASRLFYHPYLPAENQDSKEWAATYDKDGVIAYEALREKDLNSNKSPFATGDAKRNGWAPTNLALYGASHVGILGALIDTTNVSGILKLNLHSLDYTAGLLPEQKRPYLLLYNPFPADTMVALNVGDSAVNIYDLISNQILLSQVQGNVSLPLPADKSILITFLKNDESITFDLGRMLVGDEIIDFHSGQAPGNLPPRIKALAAKNQTVFKGDSTIIYCTAQDPDGDFLSYVWSATGGSFHGQGAAVSWKAPEEAGQWAIYCKVSDTNGGVDSAKISISVVSNHAPLIKKIGAEPQIAEPGDKILLTVSAEDSDGDSLNCAWRLAKGLLLSKAFEWQWTVPDTAGYLLLYCQVSDGKGGMAIDSVGVSVGHLVEHYDFEDEQIRDLSAFKNDGWAENVIQVPSPGGKGFYFNGQNSVVKVKCHPSLDFQNAITVAFFLRVDSFFTREAYPVSHGNWERRWKISITNKKLRWTVKTDEGIFDLDSRQELVKNRFYFVSCLYNSGTKEMAVYLDGQPDNSKSAGGLLLTTDFDLCLGRHLPDDANYSFRGVLDEFYLFNQALNQEQIRALYDSLTGLPEKKKLLPPGELILKQNFPNPFNPQTKIVYYLPVGGAVQLQFFDARGRVVDQFSLSLKKAGWHTFNWKRPDLASGVYFYRLQWNGRQLVRKCLKIK
ncbi:MAG: T9SS type A sorting domain-containing protein [Caldisericaceae bacterium]|nr:T9SS type A sorting domain-containing protein [Caldisericaceae bacterium]